MRAVIVGAFPWDRSSLTGVQIASQVSTKASLDMNVPELREIVHEELSHCADDEMLHAVRTVFLAERRRSAISRSNIGQREQADEEVGTADCSSPLSLTEPAG